MTLSRRTLLTATAAAVGILALGSTARANPATVVFTSPHQDDETLAMGAAIRNHVEAGLDVHVLLLTDGINSGARARTGLSRTQFAAARDDEMRRASQRLGIPTSNIHLTRHNAEDGHLTVGLARDSLNWFLDRHPGARVKSYSHLPATGRHPDHVNAGVAARQLWQEGRITDLRMYVEPWLLNAFRATHPGVRVDPERPTNPAPVRAAMDEYTIRQPPTRHGIGGLSVASFFAAGRADVVNWRHVP